LYLQYFGLNEAPFSITPDPAFVYLSAAHRDALAHLMYGVGQGGSGGFVQLTGEVGTGKTTLCRCLLEQIPDDCQVALVLNPLMTPRELLATVCEELGIPTDGIRDSNKGMVDALNAYLLQQHALGRRVVVVIDEAQNLSPEALEQVRLLTNLETSKHKLLQMVLLGQPELRQLLQRQDLRQLAQRITARYHLTPLNQEETSAYVVHRMKVAGAPRNPFRKSALRALYQRSGGVPRLINIIADRALAAAYARESAYVSAHMVNVAAHEVQPSEDRVRARRWPAYAAAAVLVLSLGAIVLYRGPLPWDSPGPARDLARQDDAAGIAGLSAAGPAGGPLQVAEGGPPAAAVESAQAEPQQARPQVLEDATIGDAGPVDGTGNATMAIEAAVQPTALAVLDADWLERQHRRAWQGIAGLWRDRDSAPAVQAACDGVARTGFACTREQGNWQRIRQLGLPVVLVLRDDAARLLVLRGFAGENLLVGADDAPLSVARGAVEEHWLGEYFVAWPQAPDWPLEIRRGESGAAVDIVIEMAALAHPGWSGGGVFDEEFESWLMSFQRRNGLQADGIIGPRTLMYLVAPTIVEPRLVAASAEGA
jgi:general secretion pathway protein A